MSLAGSDSAVPRVSVLMPTHNQASFLPRALARLFAQPFTDWELIIVDDGSWDETWEALAPYRDDPRIRMVRNEENDGLGHALNVALDLARGELIAYLPSDDHYYPAHLASLVALLDAQPDAVLAYSGARYQLGPVSEGQIEGYPLQLVQVLHRRTAERWTERDELVTDDLERLFWAKLRPHGAFVGTGQVSCEWVDHPRQRHKVIREVLGGGLNVYRTRYRARHPLRFHATGGNPVDEVAQYRRWRERPDTPPAPDGLKILLVGELAYNPERVLALEERGHTLYGLWTPEPWWFNTVGPLPFGHVTDIPREGWREAVREIQPDIIYALLNWQAVPFAYQVLMDNPGIPFVWHFKEGPWLCLQHDMWPRLMALHTKSDGQIYSSPEERDWFEVTVPGSVTGSRTLVIDGDLPKRDVLMGERSPLLSATDSEFHTVVAGRSIGLTPSDIRAAAAEGIHLHFYGDIHHAGWQPWVEEAGDAARYFHLHPTVNQEGWLREFSRYDAGWLHFIHSDNGGDLGRAHWDDLNYPARLATLLVSGVPVLQYDNAGSIFATQTIARDRTLGLFFTDMAGLGAQLRDRRRMAALRESVWRQRDVFTFDAHADDLIAFFRQVIAGRTAWAPSAHTTP